MSSGESEGIVIPEGATTDDLDRILERLGERITEAQADRLERLYRAVSERERAATEHQ